VNRLTQHLQDGQIVALPTDTVPGLAIPADAPAAAATLSALKGYDSPRPFSLHFSSLEQLAKWAPSLPPGLAFWMAEHLPQGVTAVVPREWLAIPQSWDWQWPLVGLRLPQNQTFQAVAAQIKAPLLMSSINTAGSAPLFGAELLDWLTEKQIPVASGLSEFEPSEPSAVVEFSPLPHLRRGYLAPERMKPGLQILVLCSGNICRSPVGEVMLRAEIAAAWGVAERDLAELGWHFASAGTFAMPDGPASEHSVAVAADIGLDLSHHSSANLEDVLDQGWDLILGMGLNHLAPLPDAAPKDLYDPHGRPVPDPFGGPLEAYQLMRDHLQIATADRVQLWSRWP
jgi:tRNA A37 threonylcarbamoyladenosine synthetase subunit TsaC/SUA5/YrdC